MSEPHVEYLGCTAGAKRRVYALRVRHPPEEPRDFTLSIANDAFLKGRVRYQDGPEICFLKLQRELLSAGEQPPAPHLDITDAELEQYRSAHAPKAPRRRPKPPVS